MSKASKAIAKASAKAVADDKISKKYQKLDHREHVLHRPNMYIGNIDIDTCSSWVFDDPSNKMVKKTLTYIPGLYKIFDEILVNAIDHGVRLKSLKEEGINYLKNIKVSIDKTTGYIEIFNDGDGIEIDKHPEHHVYIPELIFGHLLTSANYDDKQERIIGGVNGIGSKACNIFSKHFTIETVDAKKKKLYKQEFFDNMSRKSEPVIKSYTKKPYTIIKFLPDFEKFKCTSLTDDMYDLMVKRTYDTCAVTDPEVNVFLNGKKLEYKTFEKYVDLYLGSKADHVRVYEKIDERWEVVASFNDDCGFEQVSFVNGIWTIRGGKHVEYMSNQLVKKLIDLAQKRKKEVSIKPQYLKDNLIIFIKSIIVNPNFDSQTKETLTTPYSKFGSKPELTDKFIERMYKSGIIEKALSIGSLLDNKNMKKTDGKKRNIIRGLVKLDDANWAGSTKSAMCTLILTEGDSVTSDTPLLLMKDNKIEIKTIDDLTYTYEEENGKEYGTTPYMVWTESGWTKIKHVMRHKCTKNIYQVLTHTGLVNVTEDHSLLNNLGEEISPKDIKVDDKLLHSFPSFAEHNITLPEGFEKLQVRELWTYASQCNIQYYQYIKKAELIKLLKEYQNRISITVDTYCSITPEEAYVMGLFMADGHCNNATANIWELSNTNLDYLEKSKTIMTNIYGYEFRIREDVSHIARGYMPCYKLVYSRIDAKEFISTYREMFYDKYKKKIVPSEILNAPKNIRQQFFQGYYDGDGSKCGDILKVDIAKNSPINLRTDIDGYIGAQGIYFLCKSLGYLVSINTRKDKPKVYRLNITLGKQQDDPNRIKKIANLGMIEQYVYDIETENHHFQAGVGQMIVHNSAKTMAMAGIDEVGRDRYGVFPLKGKLLNVKDCNIKKIIENDEITNLKKIIGLESDKVYTSINDLRYGHIMIMTDSDVDGSHIKGLLFNLFQTMWPSLYKQPGFLMSMLTPIVKVKKGTQSIEFYNLTDYVNWKDAHQNGQGWHIKYYKGLGTSNSDEARHYFKDLKTIKYTYDEEESDASIDLAFNKKRADDRKEWLSKYDKENVLDYTEKEVKFQDFIGKELIHFSNYDVQRSIPSLCDGFKISQRKILFSCFKRDWSKECKVAQLSAYVSEHSSYHHGEESLNNCIVSMAQNYVGSNNINLLRPNGQMGSRIKGGKDSASPRYIYTEPSAITNKIFRKEDSYILSYLDDDGMSIEPEYYMPIIPMILVNGAVGIGTGFSTSIPSYNPKELIKCIRGMLKGTDPDCKLQPWFMGFQGSIIESEGKVYSKGVYEKVGPSKIKIKELPIGYWTEDFKEHLEHLLDTKSSYFKNYDSHYSDVKVEFMLHFQSAAELDKLLVPADNGFTKFENEFKLVNSKMMSTSNMYLFNAKLQIQKYNTVKDIIQEFYNIRIVYYAKRKEYQLAKLTEDRKYLKARIDFINEVIAGTLNIYNQTKVAIEKQLVDKSYPKKDNSYDYLVGMPIYNLTAEKKLKLDEDLENLDKSLDDIGSKTCEQMWITDLDELEKAYDAFVKDYDTTLTKRMISGKK
jgi:DNA gyrase/topoisomerase IV subunit B